jgi:hypothetical protein
MTKNFFAAAALVALASSAAIAQTDFGSPVGAGAGVGGSIAPLGIPGRNVGAASSGGINTAGLGAARATFIGATGGSSVTIPSPAGGNVVVPPAAAQALAGVLGGSPSAADVAALNQGFGSTPAGSALITSLQSLGTSPSPAQVRTAILAYNAAVRALPAGVVPGPALLAARHLIVSAVAR